MHKVEDILVWRKAIDFTTKIYDAIADFPDDEKFGITNQMKRCAVSIPSNIAEGAGRNSQKEFHHFLGIASGSSYELQTQLLISKNLQFLKGNNYTQLNTDLIEIQKMIYGLQKSIKNKY